MGHYFCAEPGSAVATGAQIISILVAHETIHHCAHHPVTTGQPESAAQNELARGDLLFLRRRELLQFHQ